MLDRKKKRKKRTTSQTNERFFYEKMCGNERKDKEYKLYISKERIYEHGIDCTAI